MSHKRSRLPADAPARFPFADYLKGVLILLVILGHLIPNEPDAIYAFHMPLFLALSGYLLTRQRLRETTLAGLCRRYWYRMLLPWAAAWAVFNGGALALHFLRGTLTGEEAWLRLIHPHGHLWFIPALFGMALLAFACERLALRPMAVLATSVAVAFVWEAAYEHRSAWGGPMALAWLGDKRTVTLFAYFYAGYYLRNVARGVRPGAWSVPAVLAAMWLRAWGHQAGLHAWAMAAIWVLLNGGLLVLCLSRMTLSGLPGEALLQWIGARSLPIYLWHMLPITLLRSYLHYDRVHPLEFYAVCLALIAAFMMALPRLAHWPPAQALLFGTQPSPHAPRLRLGAAS